MAIKHRYLSRTAMVNWQRCKRKGYLSNVYGGRGVALKKKTTPLLIGTANHAGVETLMKGLMAGSVDVEDAVSHALTTYDAEGEPGIYGVQDKYLPIVRADQRAVIESAVRLFAAVRLPVITVKYKVIEVEREHTIRLTPKLTLISRPDAVFEDDFTGALDVFSLKNPGKFDRRKDKDATVDMQGMSESFAVAHDYPDRDVKGVMMEHIVVGKEEDMDLGDGLDEVYPIRRSPLVRGWMRPAPSGMGGYEFSWRWKTDNPLYDPSAPRKKGNFKTIVLKEKDGWMPAVAHELPMGVKGWVDLIASGEMLPKGTSPINEIFEFPPTYIRRQEHIDEWIESTIYEQTEISRNIARLEEGKVTFAQAFPKSSHSCTYPGRCEFYDICWKGVQPEDPRLYEPRKPHHDQELESMED